MAHVLLCHGHTAQFSSASQPDACLQLPTFVSEDQKISFEPTDPAFNLLQDGPMLLAFEAVAQQVFLSWWTALEERIQADRVPLLCVVPASFFPALVSAWKGWLPKVTRRVVSFVSRDLCAVSRALPELNLPSGEWAIRREHPRWPWLRIEARDGVLRVCEALRESAQLQTVSRAGTLANDARSLYAGGPLVCLACPALAVTYPGAIQPVYSIPFGEGSGRQLLEREGEAPHTLWCEARLSPDIQDVSRVGELTTSQEFRKHTLHWQLNPTGGCISLFSGWVYRDSPLASVPFAYPGLLA